MENKTNLNCLTALGISWKKIPKTENYWASECGKILSSCNKNRNIVLKDSILPNGYRVVNVKYIGKKSSNKYVHRLVAETFIGPIEQKMEVNHKNFNKTDNHISNLEIVTKSQNSMHAYLGGRSIPPVRKDKRSPTRKMVKSQVFDILSNPNLTLQKLADRIGVTIETVRSVRLRRTYPEFVSEFFSDI